jgi:hypothetical protein
MKTSSAQSKVASIPSSSLKTWMEYPREEVLVKAGAEGAKAAAPAARVATIASFMVDYWGCVDSVIKEFYGERVEVLLLTQSTRRLVGVDLLGKYVIAQRTGEGREEII